MAEKLGHFKERISMIAAYCENKVFAAMTFTGYCNSSVVELWFEKMLLPELQANQVVILDNASFHRKMILQSMLDKVGCQLLPLAPYSPDLNKIEHVWNQLKSTVPKNARKNLDFHTRLNDAFVALHS